jgi:hypothetical protein
MSSTFLRHVAARGVSTIAFRRTAAALAARGVSTIAFRRTAALAFPLGALASHRLSVNTQSGVAMCEEQKMTETVAIEMDDGNKLTMRCDNGKSVTIATFGSRFLAGLLDGLYALIKMLGGAILGGGIGRLAIGGLRHKDEGPSHFGIVAGAGLGFVVGWAYTSYTAIHDFSYDSSASGGTLAGQTHGMKNMGIQAIHKSGKAFDSQWALYVKAMIQSAVASATGGTFPII